MLDGIYIVEKPNAHEVETEQLCQSVVCMTPEMSGSAIHFMYLAPLTNSDWALLFFYEAFSGQSELNGCLLLRAKEWLWLAIHFSFLQEGKDIIILDISCYGMYYVICFILVLTFDICINLVVIQL